MILSALDAVRQYEHVFLAPHLDDAALSCGGQIAALTKAGAAVLVVTLCAGSPDPDAPRTPFARYLEGEWSLGADPMARRREEDVRALRLLGCDGLHLDLLDAPYRAVAYGEPEAWRGVVVESDPLIAASRSIGSELHLRLPDARLYVPLGVGNHVDHQIVCAAGFALRAAGADVAWYEDAPYAAKEPDAVARRLAVLDETLTAERIDITSTFDLKLDAIGVYRSQRSELFGTADWQLLMRRYASAIAGAEERYAERLWV